MHSLHSHHRLVMTPPSPNPRLSYFSLPLLLPTPPSPNPRLSYFHPVIPTCRPVLHDRQLTFCTLPHHNQSIDCYPQVLSGTFIQNKLDELWALVNWATDGSLLGTKSTFKKAFIDPIMAGQDPKATEKDRESSRSATLVTPLVYPYIYPFSLHLLSLSMTRPSTHYIHLIHIHLNYILLTHVCHSSCSN